MLLRVVGPLAWQLGTIVYYVLPLFLFIFLFFSYLLTKFLGRPCVHLRQVLISSIHVQSMTLSNSKKRTSLSLLFHTYFLFCCMQQCILSQPRKWREHHPCILNDVSVFIRPKMIHQAHLRHRWEWTWPYLTLRVLDISWAWRHRPWSLSMCVFSIAHTFIPGFVSFFRVLENPRHRSVEPPLAAPWDLLMHEGPSHVYVTSVHFHEIWLLMRRNLVVETPRPWSLRHSPNWNV